MGKVNRNSNALTYWAVIWEPVSIQTHLTTGRNREPASGRPISIPIRERTMNTHTLRTYNYKPASKGIVEYTISYNIPIKEIQEAFYTWSVQFSVSLLWTRFA